ncbi:MAG: signal peptide peptidase SppA [Flavobacteriales bacterium]|nr:signal peptide peptidase SppA [Flavobacteriales bacterium]
MKPFWRSFWSASLAIFLIGGTLITLLLVGVGGAISGLSETTPFVVKENAVLHMKLDAKISEVSYAEFDQTSFSLDQGFGLREIKIGLEAAKSDDKIKGVFLNVTNLSAGMATTEEIRDAIIDFKSSGKFVYAYSEFYSQKAYYLSTAADKVYLFPAGMLEFKGLGAELMFLKGAIDKMGVDVQIIRGSNNKFKSAVEPLMYDSMSVANREQTMTYISALWNQMLIGVNEKTGVSANMLNEIADSMYVRSSKTALSYKLVDELIYEDELLAMFKEESGTKKGKDLNLVSFKKYASKKAKKSDRKNKNSNIAVVYAVGGIESGKGNAATIGSETIAGAIREAREDDEIKAVVLRVNSPGGSALASDVIWREVVLTQKAKPIIVSMGDVAASGGYYIACAADKIYAQPNTITGSIGVFGIIPNIGPALKKNFGITFDRVQTNHHSVLSLNKALTDDEKRLIQLGVDDIYNDFTQKVADGREGLEQADVDSIGQGRFWSGTDALRIGLVDELGGIDAAVAYAAQQANIGADDIKIGVYPEQKENKLLELMESLGDEEVSAEASLRLKLETFIQSVDKIISTQGIQARMPFDILID